MGFCGFIADTKPPRPAAALSYYATSYPLLYWHFLPERNFNWFIEGDFVQLDWPAGRTGATVLYAELIAAYAIREIRQWHPHL